MGHTITETISMLGQGNTGRDSTDFQLVSICRRLYLFALLFHPVLAAIFIGFAQWAMMPLNISSLAVFLTASILNARGRPYQALTIVWMNVVLQTAVGSYLLGADSMFATYQLALVGLAALMSRVAKPARLALSGLMIAGFFATYFGTLFFAPPADTSEQLLRLILTVNLLATALVITIMIYFVSLDACEIHALCEQQARTDALTGLLNRRGVQEAITRNLAANTRHGSTLSVIICDIDDFKLINDTFGHETGDEVLKLGGVLIQSVVRAGDIVARWGGEEFLIVLPETGPAEARVIADRLCSAFRTITVSRQGVRQTTEPEHRRTRIWKLSRKRHPLSATISCGLVSSRPHEPFNQLLIRTDRALYHAKNDGKNRVIQYD